MKGSSLWLSEDDASLYKMAMGGLLSAFACVFLCQGCWKQFSEHCWSFTCHGRDMNHRKGGIKGWGSMDA